MARPERRAIASAIAAWEADVDENFGKVFDAPFPIALYGTIGSLPAASEYESCLALVDVGADSRLHISNGTDWVLYDPTAAVVADSTATTTAQMASDFNDLLASLQDAGIMETS